MATLQKFKLLATQCAVAGSPTRSPTMSPVIHLRRRKTLRMLLSRGGGNGSGSGSGRRLPPRRENDGSSENGPDSGDKGKERVVVRNKLKDLFVSSPPPYEGRGTENVREGLLQATGYGGGGGMGLRRIGGAARQLRPLSATLRQRLLRRAWRPVLVAIPE